MSYTIEILENPDFLHLYLHGSYSTLGYKNLIPDVCEIILKKGMPLVLVDMQHVSSYATTVSDSFEAADLARFLYGKIHKMAILESEMRKDLVESYEAATREQGLNVKMFFDEAKAIDWLQAPNAFKE